MSSIIPAIEVARSALRWCYKERGIISGSRMVYWSWDSFFASFGALELGDTEIVRKNLELYLSFQDSSGTLPKRVANPLYFLRYVGIPVSEKERWKQPTYWNSYYTTESITQNPTFILALHAYMLKTKDKDFLLANWEKIQRIFTYLATKENHQALLWEGMGGGWAESVLKRGVISFTNMCYARSLECMVELCEMLNDTKLQKHYHHKYRQTVDTINECLWSERDGGHYSDWYAKIRHHHFATDGNLLAIWWGIADKERAEKIQAKISSLALEDDVPIKLAYDPYDYWRVFIFNRVGGIKDYHVGFSWTWLGCIDVLAKLKMDQKEEALNILERIAYVIERDQTVHEIYDKGKAVKTLFYKSEHPWGWGAGLFLYACSQLGFNVK